MLGKTFFPQHRSVLCKPTDEMSTQNLFLFLLYIFLASFLLSSDASPSTPDDGGGDSLEM
jgi:anaerobic C4-dicarboxylate transporter